MYKVFISQPMNEKTWEEVLREREEAWLKIKKTLDIYFPSGEIELIDSVIEDELVEHYTGLKYLAKSIEKLDDADAVWFLEGWEKSRGCKIEHQCAISYGIPTYYLY